MSKMDECKCCKDSLVCWCNYGKYVIYNDRDNVECITKYRYKSIEQFEEWCKYYNIKSCVCNNPRFKGDD